MTNHMQNNSYQQPVSSDANGLRPQFSNNDEIDLRKPLRTLWRSKWLILCTTVVVGCLALIYALVAPEVWTTTAKVTQPKVNDYYQLSAEVKKFKPIFVEKNDDKATEKSDLTSLIQADELFKQYIDAFNSSRNKKAFLNNNDIYKQYLTNNGISEDKANVILNTWLKNIQAKAEKKRSGSSSYYTLSSTSFSQENSYLLLKEYSEHVKGLVQKQVVEGINKTISSYTEELHTALALLREKALNRLEVEKKKTEVALQITTKAAIDEPILIYSSDDLFPINLGKNANLAKNEALKNVTDLSIFEPELITINSKLNMLSEHKKINSDIEFSTVRYIEEIELPLRKDKPKRSFIVVFGLLLGSLIGMAYVLVREAFKD